MPVMRQVPEDAPLMKAWVRYATSDDYKNSFKWAANTEHREGSMWAAFAAGWRESERTMKPVEVKEYFKVAISEFFWQFHPRRNRFCKKCGEHTGNTRAESKTHVCT